MCTSLREAYVFCVLMQNVSSRFLVVACSCCLRLALWFCRHIGFSGGPVFAVCCFCAWRWAAILDRHAVAVTAATQTSSGVASATCADVHVLKGLKATEEVGEWAWLWCLQSCTLQHIIGVICCLTAVEASTVTTLPFGWACQAFPWQHVQ